MTETAAALSVATTPDAPLPVVRVPMLDRHQQLVAYELLLQADEDGDDAPMHRLLSTLIDGSIAQLTRGNPAFLRLSPGLMLEQADYVLRQPRIGLVVVPGDAGDEALLARLVQLAQRGCALLFDLGAAPPPGPDTPGAQLLRHARYVRLDAAGTAPALLAERCAQLDKRGFKVVAGRVDDRASSHRCIALPFAAMQGGYLLLPEKVDVPVLSANRLSVLRLLRALEEENSGPVELGKIIRDDAILSYKLLGCVNSAYFALPCRIKSVEQAAIFFGLSRMRNWIATLSLSGMSDRPPELLRAALIRAQMCEQLAQGMPQPQREMAFTAGLFSLLDSLMCAPMDFVLQHLPLAPEIRAALLERGGPFAPLLHQVRLWEAGRMPGDGSIPPQQARRVAAAYLKATRWADHVFAFAEKRPPG
ncbi:HDOD domain-containing protein [Fulvimonas sp. R45]|uniref:EAL and HDOD domain-containing protein n=1 Tax=Fulvimonas sp. R45 TaxID=3045937 RepID=UPI00265DE01B|nr:HDOD domain-containing protein [Fulvimonas sp. R45]MDO1528329.1 HDOD domain-containing protein [Fulvimonas sp. R45]